MAYRFTFVTELSDPQHIETFIRQSLWSLIQTNMWYLEAHPETPMLYQSGFRYRLDPPGHEEWRDIPSLFREGPKGYDDCKDLASWRIAEVRVRYGIQAVPYITYRKFPNGNMVYHIRVFYPPNRLFPQGHIEDPSRILGMR